MQTKDHLADLPTKSLGELEFDFLKSRVQQYKHQLGRKCEKKYGGDENSGTKKSKTQANGNNDNFEEQSALWRKLRFTNMQG